MTLPTDDDCAKGSVDWPHAPPHRLAQAGVYFVTARARNQVHLLHTNERRDWFQNQLLAGLKESGWTVEAWAVLTNHYHFVAHSPDGSATTLSPMIQKLHSLCTKKLNHEDHTPGRTGLWHNYRETHLTLQRGYLARLHYVHQNAVHHGLVTQGSDYPWCSAAAFKQSVTKAWLRTITSFQFDEIARDDGDG